MKYILLLFTLLGFPQLTATATETFSCTDSSGVLHIADNLMSLPTECRDQAKTSDPDIDPGRVNYVPATSQPSPSSQEFNQAVSEEERASEARKHHAKVLVKQAQNLATSFENAVTTRKTAIRSQRYGTRDSIIAAEQQMQAARSGKKALRDKLDGAQLSPEQRQKIEGLLNGISN